MEVFMHGIPFGVSETEIHDHIERILHSPPLSDSWNLGYLMNFNMHLHRPKMTSRSRTGTLELPDIDIAHDLISYSSFPGLPLLRGSCIRMTQSSHLLDPSTVRALRETAYQDPSLLRERDRLAKILADPVPLKSLKFGWFDRDQVFSPEWKRSYGPSSPTKLTAEVRFNSLRRELCIEEVSGASVLERLRSPTTFATPRRVVIRFGSVESIFHTDLADLQPAVVFLLRNNVIFEEQPTDVLGLPFGMEGSKRRRRGSMHCKTHLQLAAYTSCAVSISLTKRRDLQTVLNMVHAAQLPTPTRFLSPPLAREHFSMQKLADISAFIVRLKWPIAFQVAALLQHSVISAKELLQFAPKIEQLSTEYRTRPHIAAEMISNFSLEVQQLPWYLPGRGADRRIQSALEQCFEKATRNISLSSRLRGLSDDIFMCYHLEITPTARRALGPFPEQTNRVLRRFSRHQDKFLRVSFTDEDRLQYRFDREVDEAEFIQRCIGGILKSKLRLAGRSFEFLAYSNSALKEHAVWFVAPFNDTELGVVTAERIRASLGNFDKVIRYPARLGARISQAFTSTNVSITIKAEEVLTLPDIVNTAGVNFTDGVGTCSRSTMDSIALALLYSGSQRRNRQRRAPFGAIQIRLGGSKGMLSVDHTLSGETIFIRPSMHKFISPSLDIEVADTFELPKPMYLNRPLIMILETLGVPISAFRALQQNELHLISAATVDTFTSARLMEEHGLGTAFRLPSIFLNLQKLGLTLLPSDDNFLMRGLNLVVNDVLRDLKHRARIYVPDSCTLVGVADVHSYLKEGQIFACIVDAQGRKTYLYGKVLVTRSPAIHPGDVQMAWAIGEPRPGSPFVHEELPNCVVFSCCGQRSLPQSLGGGDLDGDLYNIIQHESLFPPRTVTPSAYPPVQLYKLPGGRECNANDIADFVVNYFINDHLGMIANQNLIIADSSDKMSEDPKCIALARLHSIAVDFQKSGIPADTRSLPQGPKLKPDWLADEVVHDPLRYYESRRALGVLFRAVQLPDIQIHTSRMTEFDHLSESMEFNLELGTVADDIDLFDPISLLIKEELQQHPIFLTLHTDLARDVLVPLFTQFAWDLRFICSSHSLSARPLTEEECWAGTIGVKSSQHRRRNDLQARMREECTQLVDHAREDLSTPDNLEEWLTRTWLAWRISRHRGGRLFGAKSYGYVALGSMFEALKAIKDRA